MQTSPEPDELRAALDAVRQALPPAESIVENVRRKVELCWPLKPSLRVLDAESHALCKSATQLVGAGGGRFPSPRGALVSVIARAHDTLNAFGRGEASDSFDYSWTWNATGVDRDAPAHPDAAAAATLREAVTRAEASHRQVCELLDEVARIAPAELPEWDLDQARAYVAAVGGEGRRKWQHSRPPEPPHRYTVRDWRPDLLRDFLAFAQFIQSHGEIKTWGGRVDAYLELDGLEYWTMGGRVPETTVINRASVDAPEAARPLSTLTQPQRRRALERALAYRRAGAARGDTGSLSERLRALLDGSDVR